ncbi:MAG: hypothetical protein MK289_11730 [Trichodesmium sp. ALOHA_ZT_67]|nr:hypothetical protein [Trichodesmium sp. ALOHA_ZT_67]MDT9341463.1 hypothetical protein [Trichodesmium erythraeum 21-75]
MIKVDHIIPKSEGGDNT